MNTDKIRILNLFDLKLKIGTKLEANEGMPQLFK